MIDSLRQLLGYGYYFEAFKTAALSIFPSMEDNDSVSQHSSNVSEKALQVLQLMPRFTIELSDKEREWMSRGLVTVGLRHMLGMSR